MHHFALFSAGNYPEPCQYIDHSHSVTNIILINFAHIQQTLLPNSVGRIYIAILVLIKMIRIREVGKVCT